AAGNDDDRAQPAAARLVRPGGGVDAAIGMTAVVARDADLVHREGRRRRHLLFAEVRDRADGLLAGLDRDRSVHGAVAADDRLVVVQVRATGSGLTDDVQTAAHVDLPGRAAAAPGGAGAERRAVDGEVEVAAVVCGVAELVHPQRRRRRRLEGVRDRADSATAGRDADRAVRGAVAFDLSAVVAQVCVGAGGLTHRVRSRLDVDGAGAAAADDVSEPDVVYVQVETTGVLGGRADLVHRQRRRPPRVR